MLRLLEKTGGEVSAIQGALFNHLAMDKVDGYFENYLNNLNLDILTNNTISIESGMLQLGGFRIENEEIYTINIPNLPSEIQQWQLIAFVDIKQNAEESTCGFTARSFTGFIRNDIFLNKFGIYEVELATFDLNLAGISNLIKTVKAISEISLTNRIIALENSKVKKIYTTPINIDDYVTIDLGDFRDFDRVEITHEELIEFTYRNPGSPSPFGNFENCYKVVIDISNVGSYPAALVMNFYKGEINPQNGIYKAPVEVSRYGLGVVNPKFDFKNTSAIGSSVNYVVKAIKYNEI
jgi:hypothetical protein